MEDYAKRIGGVDVYWYNWTSCACYSGDV